MKDNAMPSQLPRQSPLIVACIVLSATAAADASPITNCWGSARTTALHPTEVIVQRGMEGRSYHHHCQTAALAPYFYATFSSGVNNEDDVGQQVWFTRSSDLGETWSEPRCIVTPPMGEHAPAVATATGLYVCSEADTGKRLLVACYGLYEYAAEGLEDGARKPRDAAHQNTRTMLITSEDDGDTWSEPTLLAENVVTNIGPAPTHTGRLITPANVVFLFTDDPTARTGWTRTALPGVPQAHPDDSAGFAKLFAEDRARFGYCEGSFFQTDDKVIHMMLRTNEAQLAVTESTDDGASWSPARMTQFSDNGSRHQFGRLPDGRFFALSTPDPEHMWTRTPLVLAISTDGVRFDRHFVLGSAPAHPPRFEGHAKGGRYGYPHLSILEDTVVVFYSVAKEDVAMVRFPLSALE